MDALASENKALREALALTKVDGQARTVVVVHTHGNYLHFVSNNEVSEHRIALLVKSAIVPWMEASSEIQARMVKRSVNRAIEHLSAKNKDAALLELRNLIACLPEMDEGAKH